MEPGLVRAGSWAENVVNAALIKHLSDASVEAGNLPEGLAASLAAAAAAQQQQQQQVHKPNLQHVMPAVKANSTDSTSTAHRSGHSGQEAARAPHSSAATIAAAAAAAAVVQQQQQHVAAAAAFLGPLRQASLDVLAATELRSAAALQPLPERQNIFQDVLEQLAHREELPPSGIFPMPSIQFLETLLEDLGTNGGGSANGSADTPPLGLPADAFDLDLRPTPFDQAAAAATVAAQQAQRGGSGLAAYHQLSLAQQASKGCQAATLGGAAGYGGLAAAAAQQQQLGRLPPGMVPAPALAAQAAMQAQAQVGATPSAYAGLRGGYASMPLPNLQHGGYALPAGGYASYAGGVPGAAGRPRAAVRRVQSAHDGAYDGADASLQVSRSGRARKVSSYAGNKRKSMGEASYGGGYAHPALPRHMAAEVARGGSGAVSDSGSWRSSGAGSDDSGSEVSRGSKGSRSGGARGGARGKKGKRTICLNCGCHQTPQWRCGPLGPRTLCNACGVRYKKGLPLNCWPLRDGMSLPAGAELPPNVREQIPAHWTIHYLPSPTESG